MAGIGAESVQPLAINPNQYLAQAVQPMEPVINPSAVAALSEAFRSGQVSADDIISRYGEVAKTKDKATIQGLHEFISPEAIQTRKDILNAEGGAARLKGAQFEAALPSVRRAQQVADAELDARFSDANLHPDNYDAKVKAILSVGGHTPRIDPSKGITDTQKDEIDKEFELAAEYRHEIKQAADLWTSFKPRLQEYKKKNADGTEEVTQEEIIDSAFGPVDQKTRLRVGAFAGKSFAQFKRNPSSFLDEVFGTAGKGKGTGTTAAPKPAAAASQVAPITAPAPTALPEYTADGRLIQRLTPVTEAAVEPVATAPVAAAPAPAPATTTPQVGELDASGRRIISQSESQKGIPTFQERQEILGRIRSANDFLSSVNYAEDLVNEDTSGIVGPKWDQGTTMGEFLNKAGAFFGAEGATKRADAQRRLEQFSAGAVQNSIRSLANSGNRVMKAEIDKDGGLFTSANPKLSDTVGAWNTWLGKVKALYKEANVQDAALLPKEDFQLIKPVAPINAAPLGSGKPVRVGPGAAPAHKQEVEVKGGLKLKLDPATNSYK